MNLSIVFLSGALEVTFSRFASAVLEPFLTECLNKDSMLLCICKAKIKKVSAAFANALMSARLRQTVCYLPVRHI